MCFLVGKLSDGRCFQHELAPGRTIVGRFALSTIQLEEESVSPLHAELIALNSRKYLLRDLHSQHGIAVDGREVFEEEVTAPCQLTFGRLTCDLLLEAPVYGAEEPRLPVARLASPLASTALLPPEPPLQITLPKPKRRRGARVTVSTSAVPPPPPPGMLAIPGLDTVPTRPAPGASALPFPSPERFAGTRSRMQPARLAAWGMSVLFVAMAMFYLGSRRGAWLNPAESTAHPKPVAGTNFLAHLPTPAPVLPAPPAILPAVPSAPDLPVPVAAPELVETSPAVAEKSAPSESVPALPREEIAAPTLGQDPETPLQASSVVPPVEPLPANPAPMPTAAVALAEPMPLATEGVLPAAASPEEARLAEPARWADLSAAVTQPSESVLPLDAKVGMQTTNVLATERQPWGFAAGEQAHPGGDFSADALLAANTWQLGARELVRPEVISTDAPVPAGPWQFGAGQQHMGGSSGELASLFSHSRSSLPVAPARRPAAQEKLSVMILGDSLALCGFGSRLDRRFRAAPEVVATNTYMACGTVPMSWLKDGPYGNLKTYCGFWTIESPTAPGKKPQNFQDTYGMGHGKPKPYPVPKLEDLLAKAKPDVLVLQTGTNLFSLFLDGQTVQPERHAAMLRSQIHPFLAKLLKSPHPPRAIYWVASPLSGRVSVPVQEFVLEQVRAQTGAMATVIDSRQLVTYPYRHMEPDHEHFTGADMEQWADGVFDIVQKDLGRGPLPLALTPAPGLEKDGTPTSKVQLAQVAANDDSSLRITATLVGKSKPIELEKLKPYQESMVSCVYDVQKVERGTYTDAKILIMHPAHIGFKPVASLAKLKIGKTYQLQVHELDGSPWSTAKSRDDFGLNELLPYIQVEDEARFPAHAP